MWSAICARRTLYCTAIVLLLCGSCGQCCGPGRSGGRRRSPRKLTPLVYKEHVPNVPENTLGASGLTEGRVTERDNRFHQLVPNYNKDIIFRDEEGTGVDRLMTERCKERLNTLAISVMNQWPGVRLRVTEAWKGLNARHNEHEPHSLHFEGRAVDISTTDKDRSKNGMLARLAVESGFDWVEYRSRSHIHCSVKSESRVSRRLGGCFPGNSRVMTPEGIRSVNLLNEGDQIQVMKADGSLSFSPIIMFLHKDQTFVRSFLSIKTESGITVALTPSHLVFILRRELATGRPPLLEEGIRKGEAILAGQVRGGDYLMVTSSEGKVHLEKIVDMVSSIEKGVYAPLTEEGTVIMNNVVASCYAVIDSQIIAHTAFLPYRVYVHFKNYLFHILNSIGLYSQKEESDVKSLSTVDTNEFNFIVNNNIMNNNISKFEEDYEDSQHIHWYPYMLYTIASWVLPEHLVYV